MNLFFSRRRLESFKTKSAEHVVVLLIVMGILTGCGERADTVVDVPPLVLTAQDVQINNRGVALMGYFDYAGAREAFREVLDRQPQWNDAKVNLAIATLNRQLDGDEALAREYLREVLATEPNNLRAHFVQGLLAERAGESDTAKFHYRMVLDNDPDDAYAAYYLALLTQTDDAPAALELFTQAIELDPYLRSAYYGAFLLNVRSGRQEAGREMQAAYDRLADNPRAKLVETKYTRMGPKADALASGLPEPEAFEIPTGPLFLPPQSIARFSVPQDRSITTVDLQNNGLQDVYVANPQGVPIVIAAGEDEYQPLESHVLTKFGAQTAVAWADVDNDGRVDMAMCGSGQASINFNTDNNQWSLSRQLNSLTGGKPCTDLQLLDADHDGDLDVFIAFESGGHDVLSNNGNRSFRSLRKERGLPLSVRAGNNLLAVDIDNDRDTDLLVANEQGVDVLINDRLWDYRALSGQAGAANSLKSLVNSNLLALTAIDSNADGRVELYAVTTSGQLVRWSRDEQSDWSSSVLASVAAQPTSSITLDVSDFNGDGKRDLLLVDDAGLRVLGVDSGGIKTLFDYKANVRTALHIVTDASKGPALLALVDTDSGQQLLHFPAGPGRGKFMSLAFQGREEQSQSMRSNRRGVGTHVAVRRGSGWTIADTFDRHGGRGQSSQPLAIGLGAYNQSDFIAVTWSDGVFQTELNLPASTHHVVTETQRQLSSCPVLFAWDGTAWSFVSDVLGVGGIGFLHDPAAPVANRYGEPRPWEYFALPEQTLQEKDALLRLKVTEPMEELALLDNAKLIAYDLAPGWHMVLDERMATAAPVVTGKTQFYRQEVMPTRVLRDDGKDLTESLAQVDFIAADLGKTHERFLGMLKRPHALTLEFAQPLNLLDGPLLLKASGWVEYPYSQTVFAAWQSGVTYTPPTLEAGDDQGNWVVLHSTFGYPAGMPREMSVPLGALPPQTTRLRLSGNLEIYWDRLSVVKTEQPDKSLVVRQFLNLRSAQLAQSGFPKRIKRPQNRPDYDFSQRTPFWDTRHPRGHYTEFGDVMPLLDETDGAFVIFGPGEDVELGFELPTVLAAGWTRQYVLFVAGYAKDMDMFTQDSGTVGPLPSMPSVNTRLHEQFNTRFRDGH